MKALRTATGFALAATMALTLGACGSNNAAQNTTAATTTAAATQDVPTEATTATGDVYTNEAFGISFTAPNGWNVIASEDLSSLNTPVKAVTQDASIEFVASDAEGKNIVIVGLTGPKDNDPQVLSTEQYLEAMVAETIRDMGSNYAYETSMATVTFTGLSRELPCAITKVTIDGNSFVMAQAVAEKDGYYLEMTVMGNTEEDVRTTFEAFASKQV